MSFTDFAAADLRLVILRALAEQNDYALNEAVLQKVAESFGHRQSREAIRAMMRGLEEAAAVTVTETSGILVAAITRRGLDHVEGRLVIDGVNRPGPGD